MRVRGIILSRDRDHPVGDAFRLFSESAGLLELYLPKARGGRLSRTLDLLTLVDLEVFQNSRGFWTIRGAENVESFLGLRARYDLLLAALWMGKALIATQVHGKEAPALFALFSKFLERLSMGAPQASYLIAFYGKILLHEGILDPTLKEHRQELSELFCDLAAARRFSEIEEKSPTEKEQLEARSLFANFFVKHLAPLRDPSFLLSV